MREELRLVLDKIRQEENPSLEFKMCRPYPGLDPAVELFLINFLAGATRLYGVISLETLYELYELDDLIDEDTFTRFAIAAAGEDNAGFAVFHGKQAAEFFHWPEEPEGYYLVFGIVASIHKLPFKDQSWEKHILNGRDEVFSCRYMPDRFYRSDVSSLIYGTNIMNWIDEASAELCDVLQNDIQAEPEQIVEWIMVWDLQLQFYAFESEEHFADYVVEETGVFDPAMVKKLRKAAIDYFNARRMWILNGFSLDEIENLHPHIIRNS